MLRRLTPLLVLFTVVAFIALPSPDMRIGPETSLRWGSSMADQTPASPEDDDALPAEASTASIVVPGRDVRPTVPGALFAGLLAMAVALALAPTRDAVRRARRRPAVVWSEALPVVEAHRRALTRRGPPAFA